ncbi:hypothetical protein HPB48_026754 [Haemaphysalis longicornis]|uniref:Uncharacterized protein n=1 Tax=Haemaphysalis longicornis TaxID=44386 RepID=A0A9J6HD51_HAELO|nr:hypothetical protein HPB48_026754 [Haemaphysalis longicornis]
MKWRPIDCVEHRHDSSRVIFPIFDPCHVLKNIRNRYLERELTDGVGDIFGIFFPEALRAPAGHDSKTGSKLNQEACLPYELGEDECLSGSADILSSSDCRYLAPERKQRR